MGLKLLKIAAVYLLAGLLLGIGMATAGNHLLMPLHAHVNLLGWATLGLTGLAYIALPALENGWLARTHFWLHNLGLPVMMVGLLAVLLGRPAAEPVIGVGAIMTLLGLLAFSINLWKFRPSTVSSRQSTAPAVA